MKLMKLKKNREFANVYRNGAYHADKILVVYVLKNKRDRSYFGFAVGKKVGGSVIRSRVTRLLREAVRTNANAVRPGFDIVVLARAGAGSGRLEQIERSYLRLVKKSRAAAGRAD